MKFPNRIKELRERKNWTLEKLAAEAGISVSYLSRLERSDRNLSGKTIAKIATALGVKRTELLQESRDAQDAPSVDEALSKLLPEYPDEAENLRHDFLAVIEARLARTTRQN